MSRTGKRGRSNVSSTQGKSLRQTFRLNERDFKWSLRRALWDHDGWKKCDSLRYFADNIVCKLQNFETQKWQEILSASGGKSEGHGNNNHFIPASQLPRIEKKEFIHCGYMEQYDKVFSLRLSGTERLIGIVDMNRFDILWYDPNHDFF